ncbi:MAG: YccF domain-containing protein [Emcibacter sp.]|nr:YccF domain-containing protein [Emcibacter sp.]
MSLILNILWLIFGGFFMAVGWVLVAFIMALTIVGLPWFVAAMNMAHLSLLPFGREAVNREILSGREDIGTGPLGVIGNIIWFLFGGIWLALGHVFWAVVLCITIIGIPFAYQHLKLAGLALAPIGKIVINKNHIPASRY